VTRMAWPRTTRFSPALAGIIFDAVHPRWRCENANRHFAHVLRSEGMSPDRSTKSGPPGPGSRLELDASYVRYAASPSTISRLHKAGLVLAS